ncbi:RNA polymerase sigma factor [Streptomyces sp. NPDC001492]
MTLHNSPAPRSGGQQDDALPQPSAADHAQVDGTMFTAFYETHIEGLLTYLARKAGLDATGDLASQVVEQFLLWWPENPAHPAPVAALYRIAQCRLADHLRRRGRTLTLDARDLEQVPSSDAPRELFSVVDLRVDLERALAELTEDERQALLLRYVADLPVKECAEVLLLGIDNLKKILKKALRTLRQSPADARLQQHLQQHPTSRGGAAVNSQVPCQVLLVELRGARWARRRPGENFSHG